MGPQHLLSAIPTLSDVPLIGIARGFSTEAVLTASRIVAERGIRVLEVTMDSVDVLSTIRRLSEVDGLYVGVGTVTKAGQVGEAQAAGARFVVTPSFNPAVVEASVNQGLAVICGAATPTEILGAFETGANAVKVFPAEQLGGPGYLSAIRAPLGDIPLVPTGGVRPENARQYLDAGAVALGVGSSLIPPKIVAERNWAGLEKLVDRWLEAIT